MDTKIIQKKAARIRKVFEKIGFLKTKHKEYENLFEKRKI